MGHRRRGLAAALIVLAVAACSGGATTTGTTSAAGPTSTMSAGATTVTPSATTTTPTTAGPLLAGQPGATAFSDLAFQAGYTETQVEGVGHGFFHQYRTSLDTPGTQVHCPAVVVVVGTTFVCRVDANASSSVDEPLKVDAVSPLKLEFAVIDPANFVCSAHASWVVQAMSKVGMACTTSTSQGQGQGGQGGQ